MIAKPRSHVSVVDGWVWLEPRPGSLRLRQAATTTSLAALATAAVLVYPRLPAGMGLPLVLGLIGLAVWSLYRVGRAAGTRVAAAEEGLIVQGGTSFATVAWPTVRAIAVDDGGQYARVSIVLDDRTEALPTPFERTAAVEWCERARKLAPREVEWRL